MNSSHIVNGPATNAQTFPWAIPFNGHPLVNNAPSHSSNSQYENYHNLMNNPPFASATPVCQPESLLVPSSVTQAVQELTEEEWEAMTRLPLKVECNWGSDFDNNFSLENIPVPHQYALEALPPPFPSENVLQSPQERFACMQLQRDTRLPLAHRQVTVFDDSGRFLYPSAPSPLPAHGGHSSKPTRTETVRNIRHSRGLNRHRTGVADTYRISRQRRSRRTDGRDPDENLQLSVPSPVSQILSTCASLASSSRSVVNAPFRTVVCGYDGCQAWFVDPEAFLAHLKAPPGSLPDDPIPGHGLSSHNGIEEIHCPFTGCSQTVKKHSVCRHYSSHFIGRVCTACNIVFKGDRVDTIRRHHSAKHPNFNGSTSGRVVWLLEEVRANSLATLELERVDVP